MSKKEILLNLGAILRKRRIELGYRSYEEFAHQHDITPSVVQAAESGTKDIRSTSLFKICKGLNLNINFTINNSN